MTARLTIATLAVSAAAFAQDVSRPPEEQTGEPVFSVDGATFWDPAAGSPAYEVYVLIPGTSLRFVRSDSGQVATYEVSAVVGTRDEPQVAGGSVAGRVFVPDRPGGRQDVSNASAVEMMRFPLPAGEYDLRVRVVDASGGLAFERTRKIRVRDLSGDAIRFSDVAFAREIFRGSESPRFLRGDMTVYPSVDRKFGVSPSRMSAFYEVYVPQAYVGDTLYVAYRARGGRGASAIDDTARVPLDGSVVPVVFIVNADELAPGDYTLNMRWALGGRGKWTQSHEEKFSIEWSITGLIRTDWETVVDQLRYISTNEERGAMLRALEGERAALFERFWAARDPEPDLAGNPVRDEFYRRVRYADATFSAGTPGWRTDMGRIYVLNGAPEEVDRHPYALDTKPYEIWYYYRLRKRYVFMDRNGTGEYDLIEESYPY